MAVPVSLVGTFGVMYLCGYSIDNLSLMALTISTGFVVDDAIVVIENITRYLEQGMTPMAGRAARRARNRLHRDVSISISLVAVFIPLLMMGGIVGRLFREFAVTLSVAIAVSLVGVADHDAHDVRAHAAERTTPMAGSTGRASGPSTGSCRCTAGRCRACCGTRRSLSRCCWLPSR